MDVNSRQELPAQLGPVYYQYAVDKIICSRGDTINQSMAIKCVGLYTVICRLVAEDPDLTQTKLAERLGTTFPGLNRPLDYLKSLKLVSAALHKVPGTQINVQRLQVPRPVVEMFKRDLKRANTSEPDEDIVEYGQMVPKEWLDIVGLVITNRGCDTPARKLKALGLIPFMARLAADGLPVTRPVLSRKLGMAENTLGPFIKFLEHTKLVEIEERRIPGHIGKEYAIHIPAAIVDRVRRAVRRLEKEGESRDWPGSVQFREMARDMHQQLGEIYGQRNAAE
ncbi:hypothetical protein ACRQ1B_28615 [Rhizobium panacihumi]|uniref:hypothetical protein n=1 Tax=Rhizobium panacihumi TaxID=2008450 RepID=UPI003D7A8CD9